MRNLLFGAFVCALSLVLGGVSTGQTTVVGGPFIPPGFSGILVPGCPIVPVVMPSCAEPSGGNRVFVDPVNGDDLTWDLNNPFKTVQAAIYYLSGLSPDFAGVVHCLPGVYAFNTNGEDFPITMLPHISIQGTSALDTVFDASADPGGDTVWDATSQSFVPGTAIISFQTVGVDCFDYTFVDSVSMVNGNEGVQILAEEPINPQISNCYILDCDTGVHVTSIEFTPFPGDPVEYHPCRPAILFDTIARNDIGILNDNIYTVTPMVAGYNEPAVVNTILDNDIADLEGVDLCDTARLAFHGSLVDTAGISPRIGPLPTPRIDLDTVNLPYVSNSLSYVTNDVRMHLNGNPVKDQGISGLGTTSLVAANGTIIWRSFFLGDSAWDRDGEGYGNSRREDGIVDIGADEMGQILTWGFAPLTRTLTGTTTLLRIEGRPGDTVLLYYDLRTTNPFFPASFPSLPPGTIPGQMAAGFTGFMWMDVLNDPTVRILHPAITWSASTLNVNLSSGSPFRLNLSEAVLSSSHLANLQTLLVN